MEHCIQYTIDKELSGYEQSKIVATLIVGLAIMITLIWRV